MFDEDLSLFFCVDDFAIAANLDGITVNGILKEDFIEVNFVQTKANVFIYNKADRPQVGIDSILISGLDTYRVKGMQPDGTGLNRLVLERQDG